MTTDNSVFSTHIEQDLTGSPRWILRLSGELDVATCAAFRHAVIGIGDGDLVLDLTLLRFLDAAGLGCIVGLVNHQRSLHRSTTLVGAAPCVVRIFDVVGLAALLDVPAQAMAEWEVA